MAHPWAGTRPQLFHDRYRKHKNKTRKVSEAEAIRRIAEESLKQTNTPGPERRRLAPASAGENRVGICQRATTQRSADTRPAGERGEVPCTTREGQAENSGRESPAGPWPRPGRHTATSNFFDLNILWFPKSCVGSCAYSPIKAVWVRQGMSDNNRR